ncbi:MAG: NUDIX domain-containing protein [Anaerolineae bacterium]|nr:NUDIX domain-containing protein [Anaerolineae bacterium]
MADRVIFDHRYFTLAEDKEGVAYLVASSNVLIVTLTPRNEVILIGEPSAAFGREVLVLPGGEVSEGEDPAEAANRELQEEIGYRAARMYFLGELLMDARYNTRRTYVYLARHLHRSKLQGDEAHHIRMGRVPLANFERLIANGRLQDATSISALYLAQSFVKKRHTSKLRA